VIDLDLTAEGNESVSHWQGTFSLAFWSCGQETDRLLGGDTHERWWCRLFDMFLPSFSSDLGVCSHDVTIFLFGSGRALHYGTQTTDEHALLVWGTFGTVWLLAFTEWNGRNEIV
jgi:hypothetical protein